MRASGAGTMPRGHGPVAPSSRLPCISTASRPSAHAPYDVRMLDLYTWHTPNGQKAPILLAELDWPYELHLVNLGQNEQKKPAYLAINPNGKIPALIDTERADGGLVVVFESGAILTYLADKAGRFLPREEP